MPAARASVALDGEGAAAITRPADPRQSGLFPGSELGLGGRRRIGLNRARLSLWSASVKTLAAVLTALVALEHLGFLGLEMFAWTLPVGQAAFHTTPEFAVATAALAANQGLYNGFLAAGLAFALWRREVALRLFFLGCVVVAGVFGAATAFVDILFVQALPAALAFAATLAAGKRPAPGWRAGRPVP
jgi:putative membrane protein